MTCAAAKGSNRNDPRDVKHWRAVAEVSRGLHAEPRGGPHDEVWVDLGGQVLAGGGVRPGAGVLEVEFLGLAGERVPVLDLCVDGVLEQGERGAGLRTCLAEGERAALFHGAQRGEVAEAGEQVLAGVVAEEGHVLLALGLVADDG